MTTMLRPLVGDEQGQDLAEYALLVAFVVIAIIGIANGFHNSIAGIADINNQHLATASAAIR
jgi:Flp pilus assembly pilin Flp